MNDSKRPSTEKRTQRYEFVVEFLSQDDSLDEHLFTCITINPRTAKKIAARANERVCDEISKNKQQLLLNPELLLVLQANPNCAEAALFVSKHS